MSRLAKTLLGALALLVVVAAAWVAWVHHEGAAPPPSDAARALDAAQRRERGAYLARAGNCAGCHTVKGGAAYAGGLGIETPFGTVYASNLTPHAQVGLGGWSAEDFWRAMHHGRSRDGRLLTPAFPYPNFTLLTRDDSDALFAYLQSLPPVDHRPPAHRLRFPYDTQFALAVWRTLFFRAEVFRPDAARPPEWNRGAYLVRGLGHCSACHAPRNAFGATSRRSLELSGGLIPMQNWYAPSLASPHEAGVAAWPADRVVQLLKTGRTEGATTLGPMAEVVFTSTQYLSDADLRAMAVFLQSLPAGDAPRQAADPGPAEAFERGRGLYATHCAECHGKEGQGAANAVSALAGNRAVLLDNPANVVKVILSGGFAPATAGNPRPYGMPPFGHRLDDAEVAALATYIRRAWAPQAGAVSPLQVLRLREGRGEP